MEKSKTFRNLFAIIKWECYNKQTCRNRLGGNPSVKQRNGKVIFSENLVMRELQDLAYEKQLSKILGNKLNL